jgi:transposase
MFFVKEKIVRRTTSRKGAKYAKERFCTNANMLGRWKYDEKRQRARNLQGRPAGHITAAFINCFSLSGIN